MKKNQMKKIATALIAAAMLSTNAAIPTFAATTVTNVKTNITNGNVTGATMTVNGTAEKNGKGVIAVYDSDGYLKNVAFTDDSIKKGTTYQEASPVTLSLPANKTLKAETGDKVKTFIWETDDNGKIKNTETPLTNETPVEVSQVAEYTVTADDTDKNGTVVLKANGEAITGKVAKDTKVTVEATANQGFEVEKIEVTIGSTTQDITKAKEFTVTGDATVKATFKSTSGENTTTTYAVNVDADNTSNVTVDPSTAAEGATVTITVNPADDKDVDEVTVTKKDGTVPTTKGSAANTYTFTMPAEAVTVKATFKEKSNTGDTTTTTHAVNVDADNTSNVTVDPTTAAKDAIVTITVNPETGKKVDTVTVTKATTGTVDATVDANDANKYTFTMPDEDVTVSATFADITYNVTFDVGTDGTTTDEKNTTVKYGNKITAVPAVTVTDAENKVFKGWSTDNGATTLTDAEVKALDISADTTFKAVYADLVAITTGEIANGTVTVKDGEKVVNSGDKVAEGTELTVEVKANDGYEVATFTVGGTDQKAAIAEDKYTFTVSAATEIAATFTAKDYTITATAVGSDAKLEITKIGEKDYEQGDKAHIGDTVIVKVTAPTADDKTWTLASVTATSNDEPVEVTDKGDGTYTFVVPAGDVEVKAIYTDNNTYAITPVVTGDVGGSITVKTAEGSTTGIGDAAMTVTVAPDAGYQLKTLTYSTTGAKDTTDVTDGDIKDTKTFTVANANIDQGTTAVTVTAEFEAIEYTVSAAAGLTGGSVTADVETVTVADGANVITVTPNPAEGYVVDKVTYTAEGTNVTDKEVTYDEVKGYQITVSEANANLGNITVSASFKLAPVTVTFSTNSDETVTVNGTASAEVENGATLASDFTIPTASKNGYVFKGWALSTAQTVVVADADIKAATVTADTTYVPVFAASKAVTFDAGEGNVITGTEEQTSKTDVEENTALASDFTIPTATKDGYTFKGWALSTAQTVVVADADIKAATVANDTTYVAVYEYNGEVELAATSTYVSLSTANNATDYKTTATNDGYVKAGFVKINGVNVIATSDANDEAKSLAAIVSIDASDYLGKIKSATLKLNANSDTASTTLMYTTYANYIDIENEASITGANVNTLGGNATNAVDIGGTTAGSYSELTKDITDLLRADEDGKVTLVLFTSTGRITSLKDIVVDLDTTENAIARVSATTKNVVQGTDNVIGEPTTTEATLWSGDQYVVTPTSKFSDDDNFYVYVGTPGTDDTITLTDNSASNIVTLPYAKTAYQTATFTVKLNEEAQQGVDLVINSTSITNESADAVVEKKITTDASGVATVKLLPGSYTYSISATKDYSAIPTTTFDVAEEAFSKDVVLEANTAEAATLSVVYTTDGSADGTVKTVEVYGSDADKFENDEVGADVLNAYAKTVTVANEDGSNTFKVYKFTGEKLSAATKLTAGANVVYLTVTAEPGDYYYYEDFEDAELGTAEGWTIASPDRYSALISGDDENKYLISNRLSSNNGTSITSTTLGIGTDVDYVLEFDLALTPTSNAAQMSSFVVNSAESKPVLNIVQVGTSAADSDKWTVNGDSVSLTSGTIYHYKVEKTATGVNVTITADGKDQQTVTTEAGDSYNNGGITTIVYNTKKDYGAMKLDNIKVSKAVATDDANE